MHSLRAIYNIVKVPLLRTSPAYLFCVPLLYVTHCLSYFTEGHIARTSLLTVSLNECVSSNVLTASINKLSTFLQ